MYRLYKAGQSARIANEGKVEANCLLCSSPLSVIKCPDTPNSKRGTSKLPLVFYGNEIVRNIIIQNNFTNSPKCL